ncbi:MAG: ATP-dependent Clp protease adaptor ClpS [Phycisphaerae bacterium]|nr:ATP-dependent Clp protease adaptor ClpS [Tepidisphaeraceae bacterium]
MSEKRKKNPGQPPPAAPLNAAEPTNAETGAGEGASSAATAKPKKKGKPSPAKKPPQMLPPWKVLLHNDDVNDREYVVSTIIELTKLNEQDATTRMDEADKTGVALLLVTHKERAELFHDQFKSKNLTVTIEPAE